MKWDGGGGESGKGRVIVIIKVLDPDHNLACCICLGRIKYRNIWTFLCNIL